MTTLACAIGFLLYGALCYLILGAAAVFWHDQMALATLLLGGLATSVVYMVQAEDDGAMSKWLVVVALAGWALPFLAAIKLVLWRG